MTEVKDESNEGRKKRGMGGNGGRGRNRKVEGSLSNTQLLTVRPLHCSTPCRS